MELLALALRCVMVMMMKTSLTKVVSLSFRLCCFSAAALFGLLGLSEQFSGDNIF